MHKTNDVIFLVPASPQMQRFTVGGYHLVGNQPIAHTDYAGGLAVAGTSYLPDLLGRRPKYKVRSIRLSHLAAGFQSAGQLAMDFYQEGCRILVRDACSQRDLWMIRDVILKSPLKILPVGSAALFQELFTLGHGPGEAPCMVICGSLNHQSRIQIQKLVDLSIVGNIQIDLDRALSEQRESEIDREVRLATDFYKEKRNLLIQTPGTSFSLNSKSGVTITDSLSSSIGQLLGIMVARLLKNIRISGLILTGGSIAAEVIDQLDGKGIILVKGLSPVVPVGRLTGGPYDGLRVITKGGGVGDKDILVRSVNYLRDNQ